MCTAHRSTASRSGCSGGRWSQTRTLLRSHDVPTGSNSTSSTYKPQNLNKRNLLKQGWCRLFSHGLAILQSLISEENLERTNGLRIPAMGRSIAASMRKYRTCRLRVSSENRVKPAVRSEPSSTASHVLPKASCLLEPHVEPETHRDDQPQARGTRRQRSSGM